MATNAKPRKRKVSRMSGAGAVAAEIHKTFNRLPAAEVEEILAPLRAGVRQMRQGRGTEANLASLNTMIYMLDAARGVKLIDGIDNVLMYARLAHQTVKYRAYASGAWQAPTLHGSEMAAFGRLLDICEELLPQVTKREFSRTNARFCGLIATDSLQVLAHPGGSGA